MTTFSNTIDKNKLKLDLRPKYRTRNHTIPREKIGRTLFDIHHSNITLDLSPKTKEIKAKINRWDLIQLKNFCTTK